MFFIIPAHVLNRRRPTKLNAWSQILTNEKASHTIANGS